MRRFDHTGRMSQSGPTADLLRLAADGKLVLVLFNHAQARLAARRPWLHSPLSKSRECRMSSTPQDGLIAVVKRDCPTCELTAPVLGELARRVGLQVYTQDDPSFPETVPERIDDTALDFSHRLKIEIVPALIRMENGREAGR